LRTGTREKNEKVTDSNSEEITRRGRVEAGHTEKLGHPQRQRGTSLSPGSKTALLLDRGVHGHYSERKGKDDAGPVCRQEKSTR